VSRVGQYIGRREEIVVKRQGERGTKKKRERERERRRQREPMVGGRVILSLMCVTRSTRPRTHHHRDNGVGGPREERCWMVRGRLGPPRFATKTATQRPCPTNLHDHKIILVFSTASPPFRARSHSPRAARVRARNERTYERDVRERRG